MIDRCCARCGVPIDACMGFTLGRDLLRLWAGAPIIPRELCGRCARHLALAPLEFDADGMPRETTPAELAAFIASLPPARGQPAPEEPTAKI